MIISHRHRYIFIKSKKTAGTSIEAALSKFCTEADVVTPLGDYPHNRDQSGEWIHQAMNPGEFKQHDCASTIQEAVRPEIWDSYFKFSVARNPWDRMVSLFAWYARIDQRLKPTRRFYHRLGLPFDEIKALRKKFSAFVRSDWETNDCFYIIENELCVDFVIRYEHLTEDFAEVCKKVGLETMSLPHLKSGFRKSFHYSDHYDKESKEIVAERCRNDIRLFGYTFEQV